MTKKHVSENSGGSPVAWGWEQPQCRGQAALALFIDDLHRILQAHAAGQLAASSTLADAQEQVDDLLARYNEIAGAPEIFLGQSVQLKEGVDRSGVSHTVPIFSARLKQSLVAMLGQGPG
ncbi:hypothetical protein A7P25_20800 [Achromobacter xylosoxidans]|jgi:hypothetical protein|uniref:Uncharacterized protein n=2 Tax=Achromobacter TaxID=222 RepID=A0A2M9H607_9BURK|nr:hypothetical protein [Achromobacter ruhlandii]ALX83148.1 hypothetical protein APT56_08180 [Achromobacter denitrificans]AMG47531.1 hypothetical protein AL520_27670 [Achromobacter xylosoxidans]MCI1839865.1 hypothetical protein [Achromobacter ruhlandii]MCV6797571.1 hypothetical protein [Achromobacter ruhlandii]MCV6803311.1 hypothetical protein [Achromobacter ruhlandii]